MQERINDLCLRQSFAAARTSIPRRMLAATNRAGCKGVPLAKGWWTNRDKSGHWVLVVEIPTKSRKSHAF
jgi:hypothetical protein